MTRRLVAGVDPGLDVTGFAVVQCDAVGRVVGVDRVASIRSWREDCMAGRLASIGAGLRRELRAGALDAVVLEVPHYLGVARERSERGGANMVMRGLASYFQALGVLRAVLADSGLGVLELPPGTASKAGRQAALEVFTRAGRNADERDAVVIACAGAMMALQARSAAAQRSSIPAVSRTARSRQTRTARPTSE